MSHASNLGGSGRPPAVYLRDLDRGTTTRIAKLPELTLPDTLSSYLTAPGAYRPVISGNGRYVAFITHEGLDVLDLNGGQDVYVYDVSTESFNWISRSRVTTENVAEFNVSISSDGRVVTFLSDSPTMSAMDPRRPFDTNAAFDVFAVDQFSGETTLVSVGESGVFSGNNWSWVAEISGNGRFVAFGSSASNLVDDHQSFSETNVFVRDLQSRTTQLISGDIQGCCFHGPSISGSGERVVFGDGFALYLFDRSTNSSTPLGGTRDDYWSDSAAKISENGQIVSWHHYQAPFRILSLNLDTGVKQTVSLRHTGEMITGWSDGEPPGISGDGRFVTFSTTDPLATPDGGNGSAQVYLRDLNALPAAGLADYVAIGDSLTTGFSVADCKVSYKISPYGCPGPPSVQPYPEAVFLRSGGYENLARVGIWGYTVQLARSDYEAGWNKDGGWTPQLKWIDKAQSLVTGALGINDMRFSEVAEWVYACQTVGCQVHADALITARDADFDLLFEKLANARARGVKVVVTNYYNPVEPLPDCSTSHEIAESIVDTLNEELATRAQSSGLLMADVYSRFLGHGQGSIDHWVFGSTCDDTSAMLAALPLDWFTENDEDININRDPHPNSEGASQMADEILEQL